MKFTIYTADCLNNEKNLYYTHKMVIEDAGSLKQAVTKDHVCAKYKDDKRSNDNFIESDVIVMDIDNDHTDDSSKFITEEMMDGLFPDVNYCLVPSRHHLKEKGTKGVRPRFHVMFPIKDVKDVSTYANLKEALYKKYPFFDSNALDGARFFFGSNVEEVVWHEGWLDVTDELEDDLFSGTSEEKGLSPSFEEGSRNNTLSQYAGRILKRYGESDKALEVFNEYAKKCTPPLEQEELDAIWHSALNFFKKKVLKSEGYVDPDTYNDEFGNASLKPDDYSDIGEAKILKKEYGNELIYTSATDYLRFDGTYWKEDKQLAVGACEEFMDLQLADCNDELEAAIKELVKVGVPEDLARKGGKTLEKVIETPNQLKIYPMYLAAFAYKKFVEKRRDYKYIVATLSAAKPMLTVDINKLDSNPFLLNTPSHTYDLRKGVEGIKEHDSSDLITKITVCDPSLEGKEIWEDALNTFFENDQELIDYVQKTVGVAAIGKVFQEHMIIAYGDGANGKSTFWNTIFRVLGNYSGKLSADALTTNCKRNVKPEMAEVKGQRLIIASEMDEGMRLNTSTVKQLCSTDEIYAEKKYKDPFHFTPSHTLVLYTNHLPRIGANDDGIWRRLVIIPFKAKITGSSDIKNYTDHLVSNAKEYILYWIIEGARKAIEENFKFDRPNAVKSAINNYKNDNDWLGQFIEDYCDVDSTYEVKSTDLYQSYRAACAKDGEYIRSTNDFYSSLERMGFTKQRKSIGRMIRGLKLKEGQDFIM